MESQTNKENIAKNWPLNKPKYYSFFIDEVSGSDTEVTVQNEKIVIDTPAGKNDERPMDMSDHIIVLESEMQARGFLSFLVNINGKELETVKHIEFSFA